MYKYNNSAHGDFARDSEKVYDFPRESKDKQEIRDYLRRKNASYAAVKAFEKAWKYYERYMRCKKNHWLKYKKI